MSMPTIPLQRTVKARVEVLRLGQWVDVSPYLARVEVNHGDHTGVGVNPSGADGVARTAIITLKSRVERRRYWPSTLSRMSDDLLGMSGDRVAWSTDSAEKILEWLFGSSAVGWFRENLAPRDKTSPVNLVDGAYHPLLWPNREIRVWGRTLAGLTPQETVVVTGDGSTAEYTLPHTLIEPETVRLRTDSDVPVQWEIDGWTGTLWLNRPLAAGETLTVDYSTYSHDDGWRCEFHGVIGADIRADGTSVNLRVVDLSKKLQEAYIFDAVAEPYSGPMEQVMQQILADHPSTEHITLYFPSGTPANPRPSNESPTWHVDAYAPAEMSVFDALGRLAARRGWFIGYRWHEPTQQMQLQLLAPPRWKDETTADLRLSWMTDFYAHDLADSDSSIINFVEVVWRDEQGKEHVTVANDEASIAEYGLRAGRIREDDTSEIRDEAAAGRLADAVIADLSEMRGASQLDMPIVPGLEVFTGIALDDPRVSSSEDFLGVENVLQVYDFERGRFRSQVSGPNRVVGGLTRWLGMIARPGAAEPTPPEAIGGGSVTMPAPTVTVTEATEALIVEVPEPPVYPARWAATQVQVSTDPSFPPAETFEAMDKSTRFTFDGLDGGDTYYVRAAYIDISGRRWSFSSSASGVPKRIQDSLPADLFSIELSSDPEPSSGALDNLLDKDPATGCIFPSAPTITYRYPVVQASDIVELHLGGAATGYVQMRDQDSQAWIDVLGNGSEPVSFTAGWNRHQFDGDKLHYGREYRLVLLGNVVVNELRYERTIVADLIVAGVIHLTTGLYVVNDDGSVTIDREGFKVAMVDGHKIELGKDGLAMTPQGFQHPAMKLTGFMQGFWDKNNVPSIGLGDVREMAAQIRALTPTGVDIPDRPPENDPEYGLLLVQGEIWASRSVLEQSLDDLSATSDKLAPGAVRSTTYSPESIGEDHIRPQGIGITRLGEQIHVPLLNEENMNVLRYENTSTVSRQTWTGGTWYRIQQFSVPRRVISQGILAEGFRLLLDLTTPTHSLGAQNLMVRLLVNDSVRAQWGPDYFEPEQHLTLSVIMDARTLPDNVTFEWQWALTSTASGSGRLAISSGRWVHQNDQLPLRWGVPFYSVGGETPTGCFTSCQVSCQSGCEASCQVGCETSCESSCESACQSSCESSCQSTCQVTSQGGGGCIREGTPITIWDETMQAYREVPVETLVPGMILPGYNPETDTLEHGELIELQDARFSNRFLRIHTDNGPSVDVTYTQPFDVLADLGDGPKWYKLAAKFLQPGMKLVRPFDAPDKRLSTITSVEHVKENMVHFWLPKTSHGYVTVDGYGDAWVEK